MTAKLKGHSEVATADSDEEKSTRTWMSLMLSQPKLYHQPRQWRDLWLISWTSDQRTTEIITIIELSGFECR